MSNCLLCLVFFTIKSAFRLVYKYGLRRRLLQAVIHNEKPNIQWILSEFIRISQKGFPFQPCHVAVKIYGLLRHSFKLFFELWCLVERLNILRFFVADSGNFPNFLFVVVAQWEFLLKKFEKNQKLKVFLPFFVKATESDYFVDSKTDNLFYVEKAHFGVQSLSKLSWSD